jgi:DNA-binding NtrC family response regulator
MKKKSGRTLWIIDDDELFVFYTNRIVEIESLADRVRTFKNVMSAICCLEDYKNDPDELPDIILLDIYLPFQPGWEFHEELMRLQPELKKEIKLYMVSCSLDIRDFDRVRKLPLVTDLIIKPLTAPRLKSIVHDTAKKRILIVDDESDFCFLLCRSLNQKGYSVEYVTSIGSAREVLQDKEFNMIFLDYNLMDGYGTDLLPELRSNAPRTSVVMMTANADPELAQTALSSGAHYFMNKPLPADRMDHVLKSLHSSSRVTS